jgi:ring-1,2-phenylacetyl-CoA epoxidase subunit PaaD
MGAAELPQHESHGAVLARVRAAIAHLADPEIPVVSLSELGILREVRTGDDGMPEVVITPTYSGCPAMGQIEDDIVAALRDAGLPGRVVTQLSPAWTTDWMSEAAKDKLRAYGIAPPQCGSQPASATGVLQFGSTACKALYRCLDCLEPFDYFKPY